MNSRNGGRRQGASNRIDKHDDGLARVGQLPVEHLDRENHIVAAYQRFFAQGYDNFDNLAFSTHDRNGCIGWIVSKGVLSFSDQFHECVSGHVAGGSHGTIAKEDDIWVRVLEGQPTAIEDHPLRVLYE
ncbi:MAG: hypothetical protein E2O77_00010 [Caldithrix sp.]|nr:MAG: hypothetical protein E2O77_00010 [Caldithrix sp.]